MTAETFGARLTFMLDRYGPLCVGIDPHTHLLESWGLSDTKAGVDRFAQTCVEALAGRVAMVKPQVAFFERHGSAGMAVLERTIVALRERGTLVLADAKRGDIGSTMAAYARAWLGDGPLACDALTVSPYPGVGALEPAMELARFEGRGLFVLAATSNPEGIPLQTAVSTDGRSPARSVAQSVIDATAIHNVDRAPGILGSVGVVIGATVAHSLELTHLGGPILMPGIGHQGGTPDDVRRQARGMLSAVVPSVSRAVLRAGPGVEDLRAAAERMCDRLAFLRA